MKSTRKAAEIGFLFLIMVSYGSALVLSYCFYKMKNNIVPPWLGSTVVLVLYAQMVFIPLTEWIGKTRQKLQDAELLQRKEESKTFISAAEPKTVPLAMLTECMGFRASPHFTEAFCKEVATRYGYEVTEGHGVKG